MGRVLVDKVANPFPIFNQEPSTITLLVFLSNPNETENIINLQRVFEEFIVLESMTHSLINSIPRNKKLKFPLIEEEGIISIRISDPYLIPYHPNNGKRSWLQKGLEGSAPFSNSIAIDYSLIRKNIAVKIFHTGKILLSGMRNYSESIDFSKNLFRALQRAEAVSEDTFIDSIEPQTNNFSLRCNFKLNIPRLGQILQQTGFIHGYDNVSSHSRIVMNFSSQVPKEHLKSRNDAEYHIYIYRSGGILLNGPSIEELTEEYNKLTELMSHYISEIRIDDNLDDYDAIILDQFINGQSLSTYQLTQILKIKKSFINTSIRRLFNQNQIRLVEEDRYERISFI